ncbi:hypothetical protein L195_g048593, partial [Trifolium pratense]
ESVDVAILSTSTQDLEFSTSQDSILFGSFTSPIIPVSIPSIASDFDGFSIKIGHITCFLGDSCCNDVDFTITSSEEDKQLKNFETEFVFFCDQPETTESIKCSSVLFSDRGQASTRWQRPILARSRSDQQESDSEPVNSSELDNHSEPNNLSAPDNSSEPAITLQTLINHQNSELDNPLEPRQ